MENDNTIISFIYESKYIIKNMYTSINRISNIGKKYKASGMYLPSCYMALCRGFPDIVVIGKVLVNS